MHTNATKFTLPTQLNHTHTKKKKKQKTILQKRWSPIKIRKSAEKSELHPETQLYTHLL